MAVYRVQRTRDYTVMSNYHLKDKGLTLKSKGLLSMILSLPEEWNYTTRGLASICKEGVDAIGSALKELETAGYIVRRQLRGANGRITDTEYIIYEQPQPKKLDMLPSDVVSPDTENPDMVKPDTEKPAELNIEKSNTEKSITYVLTHDSPVGWKGERTRLFLSDIGYEKALDSQANGQIKILSHAKVRNGDLFYDHKEQIR